MPLDHLVTTYDPTSPGPDRDVKALVENAMNNARIGAASMSAAGRAS